MKTHRLAILFLTLNCILFGPGSRAQIILTQPAKDAFANSDGGYAASIHTDKQ